MASILSYEGDNKTFIWKHPTEDFDTLTQLIVHESQEAIFFMNGQALDLFGPGRHTLETQNIPKLWKVLNRTANADRPFHCEVYFINKTVQMAIKWGTDSKVRYLDPEYGVPLEIGASGEMNLMVSDARKLLVKLVGTTGGIAWDGQNGTFAQSLATAFRPLISMTVKSNLSACIRERKIDILEVDGHLAELSESLKNPICAGFEEYGLTIPEFFVTNVLLPESDPSFRRIRELHTLSLQTKVMQAEADIKVAQAQSEAAYRTAQEQSQASIAAAQRQAELERQTTETEIARQQAERELIRAQAEAQGQRMVGLAEAEIMRAKGYSQKDVIQAEVMKENARALGNLNISGSGGGAAEDMLGIGVGFAAAREIGKQMGALFQGFSSDGGENSPAKSLCSHCKAEVNPNAKFCSQCGKSLELLLENEMICPSCGKKTQKGKFCMECGYSLVRKCPKCGLELPGNAKFCSSCGEKI